MTPIAPFDVSTHSRPKAAGLNGQIIQANLPVSTHSRPKAAGTDGEWMFSAKRCFNSQPPEGGWN